MGWEVIDRLAQRWHTAVTVEDGWSVVGRARVGGLRVLLAKPQTYVNVSGTAVANLMRRHRVALGDLFLVVDDLDLPLGRVRLRTRGTHGGHNGLRSVIDALGSAAFPRLRVGIGRPPEGVDPAEYVLTRATDTERPVFEAALTRAADAVELAVREGPAAAMNRYNSPAPESRPPQTEDRR